MTAKKKLQDFFLCDYQPRIETSWRARNIRPPERPITVKLALLCAHWIYYSRSFLLPPFGPRQNYTLALFFVFVLLFFFYGRQLWHKGKCRFSQLA